MNKKFIIVIGGGPAGMIAAGRAADSGARVTLIEKTQALGNKLLMTGKDRCNFTNVMEIDGFIKKFGKKGAFLYPAFYNFFNDQLRAFFKKMSVPSKEERGGRVFPESDKSEDIKGALLNYMKKTGVKTLFQKQVKDILVKRKTVYGIKTKENEIIECDAVILATGGMSYPTTGSTGDGYKFAEKLGHTIVKPRPALVALDTGENWAVELQGLTLENVTAMAESGGKKIAEEFGDMLFTHFGVSGPIILTMSKKIGIALETGKVFLHMDLKPALTFEKLDERLQRDFAKYSNKMFCNSLDDLLPQSLIPVIVKLSRIPPDIMSHSILREERLALVKLLKDLKIEISRTHDISEAIITSGGVALEEIDNHTMESKIIKGLYFAGEVVDLDAPTGGYNLQEAFSTGWLAGESAANTVQSTGYRVQSKGK